MTLRPDSRLQQPGGGLEGLIRGYRPPADTYDELVDDAGEVRGHWRPLVEWMAALGAKGFGERCEAADRHLASSGVFYRVYEDRSDIARAYRLSHLPLVMASDDWSRIAAGLCQRADLLEAILSDAYSGTALVAAGRLPAAMLAGSPEYLRPLRHVLPAGGRRLTFYAADIARDRGGAWWVIRDRTQAPSGSGYALENRMALSRALSDVFQSYGIERLAGHFDAVRSGLARHRDSGDAGICLLSPGPHNETYFEHVLLARHLGFRLVEGQDLMVRDRRLHLRTVLGPKPVKVIVRRIDADFADPLELNTGSRLGVPGLVAALRQGSVVLANALGTGLLEAPAFMGFLPVLARHLLGEDLALPNIATWWCGQPAERAHVLSSLERLVVLPAFEPLTGPLTRRPGESQEAAAARLAGDIDRRGIDFVGQEQVHLSTMPVWEAGRLVPRPFVLRVHLAWVGEGWRVMPGGMALVSERIDDTAITMQRGARAADVWVIAGQRPAAVALQPTAEPVGIERASSTLPSRAADNLFWLGRYLERAETTLRIVRVLESRLADEPAAGPPDRAALADLLVLWGAADAGAGAANAVRAALVDPAKGGSVASLIASARQAGAGIRDRFPVEAWQALEEIGSLIRAEAAGTAAAPGIAATSSAVLRNLAAVTGAALDSMNRLSGWRFLKLGGRIERAVLVCRLCRWLALGEAGPEALDALLEINGSQTTYRVRYPHGALRWPVLDLVLLDDSNPRSLAHALARIADHVAAIGGRDGSEPAAGRPTPVAELERALAAIEPRALDAGGLIGIENLLMALSDLVTARYFDLSAAARTEAVAP
jgi:uncharacterized circularly permuted ATP-grasp superfamily protein/uncharacterized alpha-E superfamily protein